MQLRVMGYIGSEVADLQLTVNTENEVDDLRRALITFIKRYNGCYIDICKDVVLSAGHTDAQKIRGLHSDSRLGEVLQTSECVFFRIVTTRDPPWAR